MKRSSKVWIGGMMAALAVAAQDPASMMMDAQAAKQAANNTSGSTAGADLPSRTTLPVRPDQTTEQNRMMSESDRAAYEIRLAKAKEKGPKRFAADLFETRQLGVGLTDGGISEDYVLGVGDQLQLSVFGSATFELPLKVDGRGSIVVPKVGTVPVAGLSLGNARNAIQSKISQIFSRSNADLSVTKLREVRVFVLGEVYKPGSFLVPSLSSVVNVLGLAGGPTAIGSYRQIRVMRGGKLAHLVDLYPLRAEGLGNFNFGFQNGDTIFVPLIQNQVILEGGFTRVVATVQEKPGEDKEPEDKKETVEQRRVKRQIQLLEAKLGMRQGQVWGPETGRQGTAGGTANQALLNEQGWDASSEAREDATIIRNDNAKALENQNKPFGQSSTELLAMKPEERRELENRLDFLRAYLANIKVKVRGDMRVEAEGEIPKRAEELNGQPFWLKRWIQDGKAPVMQFEMMPGETVKDALGFAGGFALQAFSGSVSIRRVDASGALSALEVPAGPDGAVLLLQKGDVVTALPLRESQEKAIKVGGWARVQGTFAREEGQGVGDFLKKLSLVLPDTYMERGELVRTLVDGTKQYFAFNLAKALAGDASHNLALMDRDAIELYRVGDFRLPKTLTVTGPVTRPGSFEFIEGMRASDLLFRAGVPLQNADLFIAELAHTRDGKPGEVVRLDLTRLLTSQGASPVQLQDETINPRLEPFDQLSIYGKPDYRLHRAVILSGQVRRPGIYELDGPNTSLRDVVARAGGLTEDAMPKGGIFLRSMVQMDPEKKRTSILAGLEAKDDPTSNGINNILGRLNETKRNPTTGMVEPNTLLHDLKAGNLNRLVVNFPALLAGGAKAEVELQDGDEIIIPRRTNVAYVVGETASPFASFKVVDGMKVKDLLYLAGGPTRNADTWNIRLLKADGRILDSWVNGKSVEPGDALLVPQRIKRDSSWQDNLAAFTPLAILINTFK